jgi:hypothetical protein
MNKLKTLEESGKFTDEEIKIYDKIKHFKIKRSLALGLYDFHDMPMTILMLFSTVIITFLVELYLYFYFVDKNILIIPTDINLLRFLILFGLTIPFITISIFLLCIICMSFYGHGKERKKEIEVKYYEKDTKENNV